MIVFRKVRWRNFLSTGNNFTEIELTRSKTTLIAGENGSGKSTLLDALCFSLFGKTFRKINLPQLVNSINEKDMVVEVEFVIGKKTYFIRRGLLPRLFEIFVDGVLLNQDSKSKDYQKYLEANILKLNYKSFTQVVILGSSCFIPFMQLTAHDRRDIIEDLLDIQIFSTMNVLLKQRLVELKDDLRDAEYKVDLTKEKIGLQKKYIKKVKDTSKETIGNKRAEVKEASAQIAKLDDEVSEIQKKIEALLAQVKNRESFEATLSKLEDFRTKIKKNARRANEDIKFFRETDNCPTCEQPIGTDFKEKAITSRGDKIREFEDAVVKLESNIEAIEISLSAANAVLNAARDQEVQVSERMNSVNAINKYIAKIQEEVEELMSQTGATAEDEAKLEKLREELDSLRRHRHEIVDDRHYYEIAYNILKDTGIKTKIVKQYLPVMNKLINKYLSAMDFFVNFTLDENFKEQIKSRHRDEFSYGSFSEGEKLRIDLALLFTWREIARVKNSANTNLLILDEVFDSSLDSSGTEEFLKLLQAIAGRTNIFVITHKADLLVDKFDAQIKFEKQKDFSHIA